MDRKRQRRGSGGGPGLALPSGASCQAPTAASSEGSTQTGAPSRPSPAPWDSGGHPGPVRQWDAEPSRSWSRGSRPQATRWEPDRGRWRLAGPESARRGGQEGSCSTGVRDLAYSPGPRHGHPSEWRRCPDSSPHTDRSGSSGLLVGSAPAGPAGSTGERLHPSPPACAPAGLLLKCPPGARPVSQHCPSPSSLCWATCHGSRPSGLSVPRSLKWPPAPARLSSPGQTGRTPGGSSLALPWSPVLHTQQTGPQAQCGLSVVSCPRRPWTGCLQSLDPHLPRGPEICPPTRATHSGDRVGGRGGRRPGQSPEPPGSEGKKGLVQEAAARTIPPRV